MQTYKEFRPTQFDRAGLRLPDRQDWLVAPVGRNRDSQCLDESNFATALTMLGGEGDDVECHRFGHWACGWLEIIIVRPDTNASQVAETIEEKLKDYPVLSENLFSDMQYEAASETWAKCYSAHERIVYIRKNRSQFDFRDFSELMSNARGKMFSGYASELIGE